MYSIVEVSKIPSPIPVEIPRTIKRMVSIQDYFLRPMVLLHSTQNASTSITSSYLFDREHLITSEKGLNIGTI